MDRPTPGQTLRTLERIQATYGPGLGAKKVALLRILASARLATAREVERLHETVQWLRATPDDAEVEAAAERLARGFARRPDLRRHRLRLESTGIAGTDMRYAFFGGSARWLAERWPGRLHVDWDAFDPDRLAMLEERLAVLTHDVELPAVDEAPLDVRAWVRALRGPGEADGAALARAFGGLDASAHVQDVMQDELDVPMVLRWGPGGASRTLARFEGAPRAYTSGALRTGRPDLWTELERPPRSVTALSPAQGRAAVALAREAMLVRERDLDAFMNADPRDVRLVDCGDGLAFLVIGVKPERRLLLEAVYGLLTLRNGVPIGYVLTSALFGSSEIAYNVFETYRGGEAAWVYGRVLATVRALLGSDVFTVYPYQLGGDGNDEGLASGAWWFYQKLGLRSREPAVLRLMQGELARIARRPGHRSSRATLARLAQHNVFLEQGPRRDDVMGVLRTDKIALAATRWLSRNHGGARRRAAGAIAAQAARTFCARGWERWSAGERHAWRAWAPLLLALPDLARWSPAEKRAAVEVVKAKGGRRESDFVGRLAGHRRLAAGLVRLAR
jgi:hypothetical protein